MWLAPFLPNNLSDCWVFYKGVSNQTIYQQTIEVVNYPEPSIVIMRKGPVLQTVAPFTNMV